MEAATEDLLEQRKINGIFAQKAVSLHVGNKLRKDPFFILVKENTKKLYHEILNTTHRELGRGYTTKVINLSLHSLCTTGPDLQ